MICGLRLPVDRAATGRSELLELEGRPVGDGLAVRALAEVLAQRGDGRVREFCGLGGCRRLRVDVQHGSQRVGLDVQAILSPASLISAAACS